MCKNGHVGKENRKVLQLEARHPPELMLLCSTSRMKALWSRCCFVVATTSSHFTHASSSSDDRENAQALSRTLHAHAHDTAEKYSHTLHAHLYRTAQQQSDALPTKLYEASLQTAYM